MNSNNEKCMLTKRWILAVLTSLAACLPLAALAAPFPQFTIMSEEWQPYNFPDQGIPRGLAVDMLVRMLERVGSFQGRGDIHFYPWERGFQMAQQKPGVLLFSVTRSQERQPLFKWVGPIADNTIYLFALKSRHLVAHTPADLKKYRIDTYIGAVSEDVLVGQFGYRLDELDRSNKQVSTVQKVMMGRGDLFPASHATLASMCLEIQCKPEAFEPVLELTRSQLYYVLSKDTPDAVVTQLQNAFDALKAEGVLAELTKTYQH